MPNIQVRVITGNNKITQLLLTQQHMETNETTNGQSIHLISQYSNPPLFTEATFQEHPHLLKNRVVVFWFKYA